MQKILLPLILLSSLFTLLSCSDDDSTDAVKKNYVIVPGAWSAPFAWADVKSNLEKSGNTVVVVQLPGHGSDQTAPQTLTMDTYRDAVIDAMNTVDGKVILVGHSMAGVVISEVAEKVPSKIEKLVYVAAFVPLSGQNMLDLANDESNSTTVVNPNNFTVTGPIIDIHQGSIIDAFIQDGTDAEKSLTLSGYRAEPVIPLTNPVTLTSANYGSVAKVYIKTLKDQTVTPGLQKHMLEATPAFEATYKLNTSHSPFLVKSDSVAILLKNIAK